MHQECNPAYEFTPDMIDKVSYIWTRAIITLIDVRVQQVDSGQPLLNYRMPSSMLIYTCGELANVQLNQTSLAMGRFGVLHGGKGTTLSILPDEAGIKVFMVYYKAESPSLWNKDLHRRLEQINPFTQLFGYTPGNPLRLLDMFQQMTTSWQHGTPLEQLNAKALLLQSIREVYKDLRTGKTMFLQPDPVMSTKRYLDEQYANPMLFEEIADLFAISRGQLTRLFKRRTGKSLQEYLTLRRLEEARHQLLYTNATVKEIALGCGMTEELNLIRLFRKYYRMTPSEFRNKKIASMHACDIDNYYQPFYNERGLDSLAQIHRDGEFMMLGQTRGKEMILAAAMSLMLLLSACASNTAVNNGGAASSMSASSSAQAQQVEETQTSAEPQTRIVKTTKGDVQVPANPQRVVVQYLMGDVVSMGVMPVGVSDVYEGAAFSELVLDSTGLGWFPEWEGESIMLLDPDLILVIDESHVEKFSEIAPTVYIPHGDMTQNERLTFIGEVLNRQEEAAEAIKLYDSTLAEAKSKLSKAGFDTYTVSVFEGGADRAMDVHGSKYGTGSIVYASLGLRPTEAIQKNILDKDSFSELISFEVLNQYSGDFIIRNVYDEMPDLSGDAIWNAIPAVQANRMIDIDFGFSYYSDIYSATAQINYVTDALLRALD